MDASSLRHALAAGKVGMPAAHARHIAREALLARIGELACDAVVLVRAPAGFGKTTLLGQCAAHFVQTGARVIWLTLDRADNDVSRFLQVLAAALDAAGVRRSVLAGDDTQALTILDALQHHTSPLVLIFDDMESIDDPAVLDFLNRTLFALTPVTRVLMGARHVPGLAWHRLRMAGRLVEFDTRALAFSLQETTRFFNQGASTGLTPSDMQVLHDKTEGWVAALWLASLSLAGVERASAFVAQFAGDDRAVAQCLSHDVFDRQAPQTQRFLLATSILRRIDAPLCQALLPGLPCAAIIEALADADIILRTASGDGRAYRYHSMFATYLQARLRTTYPDEVVQLHRQAAAWYDAQGRVVPAIEHAMDGGDFGIAASLLHRHAATLLEQGRMRLLARWFAQLPAAALLALPELQAIRIWATLFSRGPADAMVELDALDEQATAGPQVQTHRLALRPLLLSMLDRHEQAYAIGIAALTQVTAMSGQPSFAQTALTNAMAHVCGALGRYAQARELLDRARASQSEQSLFNTMYSEAVEGSIDLQAGRFAQASARFRLAVGARPGGMQAGAYGNAWAGVLHAACVYETGDLAEAARLLDVYVPLGRDVGLPDHLILGYVMQSRIAARSQSVEQAFVLLGELEYLGHHRRLPRIAASARLERARVLLLQGHAQASRDEMRRADNPDLWAQLAGLRLAANDFLYPAMAQLRWQTHAGDARQALVALAHERAAACAQGRVRRTWKLDLLASLALARTQDQDHADDVLAPILSVACDEGLHGFIVDEGASMTARLIAFARGARGRRWLAAPARAAAMARWTGEVEGAVPTAQAPVVVPPDVSRVLVHEALTPKEAGVLNLLAEGLSNTEIAARLFVSESTVRTHLRSLNVKLSANSRTQAVARARRAGLIV
ncbi:MAG: helix-turn-helix transcriptional regulator [Comamonadaceae bacterium]|nr:MAG: helix-turn-helix transcriptional regulator [Comamonadaceae bacterium]